MEFLKTKNKKRSVFIPSRTEIRSVFTVLDPDAFSGSNDAYFKNMNAS